MQGAFSEIFFVLLDLPIQGSTPIIIQVRFAFEILFGVQRVSNVSFCFAGIVVTVRLGRRNREG